MTRSAPSTSGRVNTGVAAVESTASFAPARCAIAAMPAMSLTVHSGLAGVSIQTSFVLPRLTAARTALRSLVSTRSTVMPRRGASVTSQLRNAQYITSLATTCAPRGKAITAAVAADMPEPNSSASRAPSSAAMSASPCQTVALSGRP